MKKFYTYMWLRYDGTPYYVGKGTGERAFSKHHKQGFKNPPPRKRIIVQEFNSDAEACKAEKFIIDFYGRSKDGSGCLRNLADGGHAGLKGTFRTNRHQIRLRQAIIQANRSRHWSEEARLKIVARNIARRDQIVAMNKSRIWSKESRRKASLAKRGRPRPWTDERRAKHKAMWASQTHCKNGHPYTIDNTYIAPMGGGKSCRLCRRAANYRRSQ